MNYVEISKDAVFAELGTDAELIVCDFDTLRMMDCNDMNISAINSFLSKKNTKFYKGVADE